MKKIVCCVLIFMLLLPQLTVDAVSVSAKSAVVINGDSGEILFSHNADAQLPMASTTKIMTALLLCEYGNFDKEITVTEEMVRVEGSSMGLLSGDKVTLRSLLYGMMLPSGNDAANTTAIVVGGNVKNFVSMMNKKAIELGLKNTHFVTPSGLDAEEHYTTAYELCLITREALKNEHFAAAVSSQYETLYYGNPPYRRTLKNHNKLLKSYDGLIGVKTGFTKKSGRCLVTAARRDGKLVIAATLNAPDDWNDHKTLLDFGLSSLERKVLQKQSLSCPLATDGYVTGFVSQSELTIKPEIEVENEIYLPRFLYPPLKKGDIIGEIHYIVDNKTIKNEVVISNENVSAPKYSLISDLFNIFISIVSFI